MYLLASAFLLAGIYSYFVGDIRTATAVVGVALVLGVARLFLGAQQEASVLRKLVLGIATIALAVAVMYAALRILE